MPTTHSLGKFARAALGPLPPYVHAYFHDHDLTNRVRRAALYASLRLLHARTLGRRAFTPASVR